LSEEACAGKPQAGFCEGEAYNDAGLNLVALSIPKGERKQRIQSKPKHWRSPPYSTTKASPEAEFILLASVPFPHNPVGADWHIWLVDAQVYISFFAE